MIRGDVKRLSEAFYGMLCVAFDSPEIPYLVEYSEGLWILRVKIEYLCEERAIPHFRYII